MLSPQSHIPHKPEPDTHPRPEEPFDSLKGDFQPVTVEGTFPECMQLKTKVISLLSKELPKQLYYHNSKHTLDVCKSVERLSAHENLGIHDLKITWTAALLHDTGFLFAYNNNEELACRFAKELLPNYGFSPIDIEQISSLIMATSMPQAPQCLLDKILCDADLDYLGRDDFFITALRLHREWSENSGKKIPFKDWYEKQRDFMACHTYFTLSAQTLRNNGKARNLEMVHELIEMIDVPANIFYRKNY